MSDYVLDSPFPMKEVREVGVIHYGKGLAAKVRNENGSIPVY